MKRAGHREAQLFTILERINLAVIGSLVLFLAALGFSIFPEVITSGPANNDPYYSTPVIEAFNWILEHARLDLPASERVGLLVYLSTIAAIFWTAGRFPKSLALFFAWPAGWLAVISAIGFAVQIDNLTVLVPLYAHRSNWMFWYIRPITSLLFEFTIALGAICFAGELTRLVQERSLRQELSAATNEGEADEKKTKRRHMLISEASGPRLPVALPLHYALILIFLPALGLGKLFEIASYRRDLELSGPQFLQALATPPKGEAIRIRITAWGQILLGDELVAHGRDKECDHLAVMLREIRSRSGEHFIALEMDSTTRYDRLITLLNVTERLNFPIYLQD